MARSNRIGTAATLVGLVAALAVTPVLAQSLSSGKSSKTPLSAASGEDEVLFTSSREGALQIYRMDAEGGNAARLSQGSSAELQPVWSRHGVVAFVSYRSGGGDIYTMNADGSAVQRLTQSAGLDQSPAWSPDGRQLVYVGEHDGQMALFVINGDGSGQRRISAPSGEVGSPQWAPDGKQIAFTAVIKQKLQILLVDLATGATQQLTQDSAGGNGPMWSPDGKAVVYVHAGGRTDGINLRLLRIGEKEPVALTKNGYTSSQPRFSPDGSKLLYLSNASNQGAAMNVHVMNADGTGATNLTHWQHADMSADWSADGRHVYFMSFRDWPGQLYRMTVDGQDVRRLTDSKFQDGFPAVRPARKSPLAMAPSN